MKALAIGLIWLGYAVFAYGVDHITSHCTPLKTIMWPVHATSGDISVACPTSKALSPPSSAKGQGGSGVYPGGPSGLLYVPPGNYPHGPNTGMIA